MIKKLLFSTLLTVVATLTINAQCNLIKDSIVAGTNGTQFRTYFYNDSDQLVKVEKTYSNGTAPEEMDTITYNVAGDPISLQVFYGTSSVADEIITYTYNGSNHLETLTRWTNYDVAPSSTTHTFTYNGAGEVTDMKITATTGDPDELSDFENMVWTNGNVSYLEFVTDFGSGTDRLEVNITADNKNNVNRHQPYYEVSDYFFYKGVNNLTTLTLANNETIGNAGDILVEHAFTYYGNNEVETMAILPGIFSDGDDDITLFSFDCATSISSAVSASSNVQLYPNPSATEITITTELSNNNSISILDLTGKIIETHVFKTNTINVSVANLNNGIYFYNIYDVDGNILNSNKFVVAK